MELTEEDIRRICRGEIKSERERAFKEFADSFGKRRKEPKPWQMGNLEAANIRNMGLDPFEEVEKPKPGWMSYCEAAELRMQGIDPFTISREAIRGTS